jgi:D-alanyl-D-alanine carboxypeptidase
MPSTRARRSPAIAFLLAVVALLAAGCGGSDEGGDTTPQAADHETLAERRQPPQPDPMVPGSPPRGADRSLSPLDVHDPELANLDPDLLEAVQQAHDDAAADGVPFWVTSGWRSEEQQQQLLDEAVVTYGSLEEALKFVATPDKSAHVSGDAVDIGPTDADDWLIQHGDRYGLCQAFANEMWHFELSVDPGDDCPQPLTDGTYR